MSDLERVARALERAAAWGEWLADDSDPANAAAKHKDVATIRAHIDTLRNGGRNTGKQVPAWPHQTLRCCRARFVETETRLL